MKEFLIYASAILAGIGIIKIMIYFTMLIFRKRKNHEADDTGGSHE